MPLSELTVVDFVPCVCVCEAVPCLCYIGFILITVDNMAGRDEESKDLIDIFLCSNVTFFLSFLIA